MCLLLKQSDAILLLPRRLFGDVGRSCGGVLLRTADGQGNRTGY